MSFVFATCIDEGELICSGAHLNSPVEVAGTEPTFDIQTVSSCQPPWFMEQSILCNSEIFFSFLT